MLDRKVEKLYQILKLSWHHEDCSPFLYQLYDVSGIPIACSTDTRSIYEHKCYHLTSIWAGIELVLL